MANPTPPSQTPMVANAFQQPPTLAQIQTKVRRLTRSPSEAQLSTSDLNNYINTFIVYDFPEQLRTFNLRAQFSFYTNPGQDVYNTDIASFGGNTTNLLYNFQNLFLTIHPPVYIAGYQSFFSQSREQFYAVYPKVTSIATTGAIGNGVSTTFTGVINANQSIVPSGMTQNISLLQNEVLFSSIDINGIGLSLVDVPLVDPTTGYKTLTGNLYDPNSAAYKAALINPPTVVDFDATNNINYLTGAFTITFTGAPASGAPINSQSVPQATALSQALLFYQNQFVVRPVPDQAYAINFEVFQRPTALLANNQVPELEEYWQLIAYGASRKILQDRMDIETVALIEPEFREQMRLCLRRSLVQWGNDRAATIYTEQTSLGSAQGWGWGQTGGSF